MEKSADRNTLEWEYREANEWWRAISRMHRTDMTFFTAVQAGVLGIIRENLLDMSAGHVVLSMIAFAAAIIAILNEIRLYAYLTAFRDRGKEIEEELGMSLIKDGIARAKASKPDIRRKHIYFAYYGLLLAAWLVIWVVNLC
ncbi:MAG: hypothetical protein FVQ82_02665 [Planctomycetes bacterium]|nr:hypothetical protein [Planctomycetota bacterium]